MENLNVVLPLAVCEDEGPGEACWDLPAVPEAVSMARGFAREALAGWGLSDLAQDVAMAVSETVTNALVHAAPPITLSLHRRGGMVRGEVTDHTPTLPSPLRAGPDEEHGRGLAILTACSDRWGVEPAPGGKTVWFIRARPGSR